MSSISVDDIVNFKLHVGNLTKQSDPKTRNYVQSVQNGVMLIDPTILADQLQKISDKIHGLIADKKTILIVCDKSLYSEEIVKLCENKDHMYYMVKSIPAGILTNFETLKKSIANMNESKIFSQSDSFKALTKKEQSMRLRKLKKVEAVYEGVKDLKNKPDFIVVVCDKTTNKFVDEISNTGIDNLVIASTAFNRRRSQENLLVTNINNYKSMMFVFQTLFG
jgi:small subunit ribosomal protein S2